MMQKTFTVGTNNLSITAEFEPVPDTSTEKPTDPSEEVPSTPDPKRQNKPDVGNNNNNNGSNNSNNTTIIRTAEFFESNKTHLIE